MICIVLDEALSRALADILHLFHRDMQETHKQGASDCQIPATS